MSTTKLVPRAINALCMKRDGDSKTVLSNQ